MHLARHSTRSLPVAYPPPKLAGERAGVRIRWVELGHRVPRSPGDSWARPRPRGSRSGCCSSPSYVADYFAWDVAAALSRMAFIGAGYVFRTAFFLNAAFERNWLRLRWIVWGNLVFTGTLLLATYWHVDEFHWNPFETPLAHIWIVLYIFEPVTMLYLVPRGIFSARRRPPADRSHRLFKRLLVFLTGLLLMHGLLLVVNPEFAATRWPWELNPLDARMVAAWFLGWSVWCGTMAFARDWDEIRRGIQLFILNGVALLATVVVFRDEFMRGP